MKYNPQIHHRRSIRLKGYDYSQAGLYFITICCQDRAPLFGHIDNGIMILNEYGEIAFSEWQKTEYIRKNCCVHESVIMPNHIHGIIEIAYKEGEKNETGTFQSPSQTIGAIIRGFKIAVIKRIKDLIQQDDHSSSTGELQFAPTEFAPTKFNSKKFNPTEKIKSLDYKIWQRNYYEHIIRDEQSFQRIAAYIVNNPRSWKNDKFR